MLIISLLCSQEFGKQAAHGGRHGGVLDSESDKKREAQRENRQQAGPRGHGRPACLAVSTISREDRDVDGEERGSGERYRTKTEGQAAHQYDQHHVELIDVGAFIYRG